jgi:hypothetical protein
LGKNWGILEQPQMKINQLKIRFTEITGYEASHYGVFYEAYCDPKYRKAIANCAWNSLYGLDLRRKRVWEDLIAYLEASPIGGDSDVL